MSGPNIIRTAHGEAAKYGAQLVAEQPPLDEYKPLDKSRTEQAQARRKARGLPGQPGNKAASGRGPSLTRVATDPTSPEEVRRVHRKAASLANARKRELESLYACTMSVGVKAELVAWARNMAWAESFDRMGDAIKAATLSEKASGHHLKAVGLAEREAACRAAASTPKDEDLASAFKQ